MKHLKKFNESLESSDQSKIMADNYNYIWIENTKTGII